MHIAIVESLKRYIPKVHDEPGCELYALHESMDGAFVILERWTALEVLKSHVDGPAVSQMSAEVGLAVSPDVRIRHAVPVGDRAMGQILV